MENCCEIEIDAMIATGNAIKIISGQVKKPVLAGKFVKDESIISLVHPSFSTFHVGSSITIDIPPIYLIPRPLEISPEKAISGVYACLEALTGLHYSLGVLSNESILIVNSKDSIPIEISKRLNLKVYTSGTSPSKSAYMHIFNAEMLLKDTGGLGVKHILDFSKSHSFEDKVELLKCLGFRGNLCICNPNFQLDPPESNQLFMRGASLRFLNTDLWVNAGIEHGILLHLMKLSMEYLRNNLDVNLAEVRNFSAFGTLDGLQLYKSSS